MTKKRVLWIAEAPFINTGYAVYTKHVLDYLSRNGVEVYQLGVYCKDNDKRKDDYSWTIIPNHPTSPEQEKVYNSSDINQFGAWQFENICSEIKPDVVCSIADFWMFEFIMRSPYVGRFKTVFMPTCDAGPQPKQWTDVYSRIDKIFTYNDWSYKELSTRLGNFSSNMVESAPPVADEAYYPKNRLQLRHQMGIDLHTTIFGTVMRNQKRKLYPQLFQAFRMFLDNGGDAKLLCHTSYPDKGWDIQGLLKRYNLTSQVLFSYTCVNCKKFSIEPFKSIIKECPSCKKVSCKLCNVDDGLETQDLANLYNLMNLYIQPCTNEGFGMPIVEAAACGTPIAATNYSAPHDIIEKLEGYPLSFSLQNESESGMDKAIVSSEDICQLMTRFYKLPTEIQNQKACKTRELFEKHYNSWKTTGHKWLSVIQSLTGDWNKPADIKKPNLNPPDSIKNNYDLATWAIENTLCDPSKLYTLFHARLIRDMSFGFVRKTIGGEYDHEMPAMQMYHDEISHEDLLNVLANKRKSINDCEKHRTS